MRCTLAGTAAAFLLASAALMAAEFWEDKDFTSWSPQQVDRMLTDSPWAKKATIVLGSLREDSASGGGFQGGGAGFGGGGGGGRGGDGSGAEFSGVRRIAATVAWISALPVRQAIARRRAGVDAPVLPDEKNLPEDEAFYVVAVAGMPTRVAQAGTLNEVLDKTALKSKGKAPIKPADIRIVPETKQTVRVEFVFPRSNAITLDDKEIEFVTKMGPADIAKKFTLADMVVRGRLAL
jgi:hypothetical protein